MKRKEFELILRRDLWSCYHCGISDDTLVPQHRLGRGMGGSKNPKVHAASNIITFCSDHNGKVESNSIALLRAKRLGWKLESWEDPLKTPAFHMVTGEWYVLHDNYTREVYNPSDN
jgi:hypothetical protein